MASLIKKKKGNRLYYYLVESARVDGQPRIVHQAYLGTAEKLAELVQQKSAPVPLSATLRDFGLPGALWLAAKQSGLWPLLESLWPAPRSGPGPAHYLLLAAIHRICDPGPKTEVSDWHGYTDASATVASVAMPQQWSVCAGGKSPLPANLEELIDFAGGVSRQRDEARFVKLGCSDYQYPLMRVVIPHRQPCQLTTSESCRVQEHDRQANVLGTEGRI